MEDVQVGFECELCVVFVVVDARWKFGECVHGKAGEEDLLQFSVSLMLAVVVIVLLSMSSFSLWNCSLSSFIWCSVWIAISRLSSSLSASQKIGEE